MAPGIRFAISLAFALLACGGATSLNAGGDSGVMVISQADGAVLTAAQCSWPSSLNTSGSSCRAARLWVSCGFASGAGCGCVSNEALDCPGCGPSNGATCHDECAANEYVVSCAGIGPSAAGANVQPPDACRFAGAIPAGIAYYCCPCE